MKNYNHHYSPGTCSSSIAPLTRKATSGLPSPWSNSMAAGSRLKKPRTPSTVFTATEPIGPEKTSPNAAKGTTPTPITGIGTPSTSNKSSAYTSHLSRLRHEPTLYPSSDQNPHEGAIWAEPTPLREGKGSLLEYFRIFLVHLFPVFLYSPYWFFPQYVVSSLLVFWQYVVFSLLVLFPVWVIPLLFFWSKWVISFSVFANMRVVFSVVVVAGLILEHESTTSVEFLKKGE